MNFGDWIVVGLLAWIILTFPLLLTIGRWFRFVEDKHRRVSSSDE